MKIVLEIQENRMPFFIELIKNFSFIKIEKADSKKAVLKNIEQGLKEVQMVLKGKLKSRSAKAFLDEL